MLIKDIGQRTARLEPGGIGSTGGLRVTGGIRTGRRGPPIPAERYLVPFRQGIHLLEHDAAPDDHAPDFMGARDAGSDLAGVPGGHD